MGCCCCCSCLFFCLSSRSGAEGSAVVVALAVARSPSPNQKTASSERSSSRPLRTAQSKDLRLSLRLHLLCAALAGCLLVVILRRRRNLLFAVACPLVCHSAAKRRNLFLFLAVALLSQDHGPTLDKFNPQKCRQNEQTHPQPNLALLERGFWMQVISYVYFAAGYSM
jgi:hypothetical protein